MSRKVSHRCYTAKYIEYSEEKEVIFKAKHKAAVIEWFNLFPFLQLLQIKETNNCIEGKKQINLYE